MCVSIKAPAPPPMPEPIPAPPPNTVSGAITRQKAPGHADAAGRNVNAASSVSRIGEKYFKFPLSVKSICGTCKTNHKPYPIAQHHCVNGANF